MPMFHIDPRIYSEVTPELKKLYKKFNAIADSIRTIPTISGIRSLTYYSIAYGTTETIDELNSNFEDFLRSVWSDSTGRMCYGTPIYVDATTGIKYSDSSHLPDNIVMCQSCGKIHAKTDIVCPHCQGVANCGTHDTPKSGWLIQKTRADVDADEPLFGFEIEMEFPDGVRPEDQIRQAIRDTGIAIPGVIETDGSLRNGREYVTHPMTFNYLWDNHDQHIKLIKKLIDLGARDVSTSGNQNAGIHIHVNYPGVDTIVPESHDWMKYTYPLRLAISGRQKQRFNDYSGGETGLNRYHYIGKRNRKTWECRGFSFSVLKNNPDALPHLAAYAQSMANMLSSATEFNARKSISLCDLLRVYEYTEAADWFASVYGNIVTDPMYGEFMVQCRDDYNNAVKAWARNMGCREVVRREDWIDTNDGTSVSSWICLNDHSRSIIALNVKSDMTLNICRKDSFGGHDSNSVYAINCRPKHMTDEDRAMMPPRTFSEYYAIRKSQRAASQENPLWDPSINDAFTVESAVA